MRMLIAFVVAFFFFAPSSTAFASPEAPPNLGDLRKDYPAPPHGTWDSVKEAPGDAWDSVYEAASGAANSGLFWMTVAWGVLGLIVTAFWARARATETAIDDWIVGAVAIIFLIVTVALAFGASHPGWWMLIVLVGLVLIRIWIGATEENEGVRGFLARWGPVVLVWCGFVALYGLWR